MSAEAGVSIVAIEQRLVSQFPQVVEVLRITRELEQAHHGHRVVGDVKPDSYSPILKEIFSHFEVRLKEVPPEEVELCDVLGRDLCARRDVDGTVGRGGDGRPDQKATDEARAPERSARSVPERAVAAH